MKDHAPTSTFKFSTIIGLLIYLWAVGIMCFVWADHVFDNHLHSKKNEIHQMFENIKTCEPGDLLIKQNKLYVIDTKEVTDMQLRVKLSELSVNHNGKLITRYHDDHHGMSMPISCDYCHKE